MSGTRDRPQTSTHPPVPLPRVRRNKTQEVQMVSEPHPPLQHKSESFPRDLSLEQGTTPLSQSHEQPSPRPRPVARKRTSTDSDLESSMSSSSSPLTSVNSTHALSQRQVSTCDSIAEELDIYTDENDADTFIQPGRDEEERLKAELDRMKREKESLQGELQTSLARMRLDEEEGKIRVTALNRQVVEVETSLASLRERERETGNKVISLHKQERELEGTVGSLRAETARLEGAVERLHSTIDSLRREEQALNSHVAQLQQQERELNASRENAFSTREQALIQREQDLRLREEHFSSQTSDHDYHVKQEQSRLQAWEDQLHMRKKDLDHREFDLRNSMPPTGVESSAQMAELASRELSLQQHETDVQHRENGLRTWAKQLEEEAARIQERARELEERQRAFERHQQQATYHPPRTPPPTVPPYYTGTLPYATPPYVTPSTIIPSPTVPPTVPPTLPPTVTTTPTVGIRFTTPITMATAGYSSSSTASPLNDLGSTSPYRPPVERNDLSRTGGGATGYTPVTSTPKPTRLINEDEEIARLLADENKLLLSQDEELARQLQEEEERSLREAAQQGMGETDQDHQLALQLQKEQLEAYGTDLTIHNKFGTKETIRTVLQEKLTHEVDLKEQEKQDFLLAQQMAQGDNPNDLGSTPINDLNS